MDVFRNVSFLQNLASMVGNVAFEYCPAFHMLNVFQNQLEAYKASEVRMRMRNLSRHTRTTICICEYKDANQLFSNCTADQYLGFRCTDSTGVNKFIECLVQSIYRFVV